MKFFAPLGSILALTGSISIVAGVVRLVSGPRQCFGICMAYKPPTHTSKSMIHASCDALMRVDNFVGCVVSSLRRCGLKEGDGIELDLVSHPSTLCKLWVADKSSYSTTNKDWVEVQCVD